MASKEVVQRTLREASSAAIGLERATDGESRFVDRLPNYDETLCTARVEGLLKGEIERLQSLLNGLKENMQDTLQILLEKRGVDTKTAKTIADEFVRASDENARECAQRIGGDIEAIR